MGVLPFVLQLPQAGQAGGGAEFQGFGVLAEGDGAGMLKTSFSLSNW
jgi:hypothetical protein